MPAARKPRKHVINPSLKYNFRVKWDGRIVAGITKVSALRRTTEGRGIPDLGARYYAPHDARGLGTPGLRRNRGAVGVSEGSADRGVRHARTVGAGV